MPLLLLLCSIVNAQLISFKPFKKFNHYKFKKINCFRSKNRSGGFYCINNSFKKNILISAPHSKLERHTFKESIALFIETGAHFLAISTAHRCSSDIFSTCSGQTKVCGKKEKYKMSDLAHNVETIFYKFHKYVFANYSTKIIQLHETKRDKISFIISAGSKQFKQQKFITNKIMIFVNKNKNPDSKPAVSCQMNYHHLCGTTNTIGRLVNGSKNSCLLPGINIYGNFIHIEQNYRLFNSKENPTLLLTKMINTFF